MRPRTFCAPFHPVCHAVMQIALVLSEYLRGFVFRMRCMSDSLTSVFLHPRQCMEQRVLPILIRGCGCLGLLRSSSTEDG